MILRLIQSVIISLRAELIVAKDGTKVEFEWRRPVHIRLRLGKRGRYRDTRPEIQRGKETQAQERSDTEKGANTNCVVFSLLGRVDVRMQSFTTSLALLFNLGPTRLLNRCEETSFAGESFRCLKYGGRGWRRGEHVGAGYMGIVMVRYSSTSRDRHTNTGRHTDRQAGRQQRATGTKD